MYELKSRILQYQSLMWYPAMWVSKAWIRWLHWSRVVPKALFTQQWRFWVPNMPLPCEHLHLVPQYPSNSVSIWQHQNNVVAVAVWTSSLLLLPANEVCEGYVFTHVCHSVQGGCMRGRGHAWHARRPPADTTRYGQWVGGTHPTAMHSCSYYFGNLLVSTYVVCERLSVMHEPAGVVEILVQIPQNTPIL